MKMKAFYSSFILKKKKIYILILEALKKNYKELKKNEMFMLNMLR